jgi:4-aminobutyrate aminotransferase-like enzyme
VLDVLRDEGLQENARVVGERLRASLRALDHPSVGDVRGAGLFTGVELVEPDGSEASGLTLSVVNALQRRRVLVATGGLHNNVLKVRPPLVFSDADTDRFVTELDAVLTELDA